MKYKTRLKTGVLSWDKTTPKLERLYYEDVRRLSLGPKPLISNSEMIFDETEPDYEKIRKVAKKFIDSKEPDREIEKQYRRSNQYKFKDSGFGKGRWSKGLKGM